MSGLCKLEMSARAARAQLRDIVPELLGAVALVSKKWGKRSNRAYADGVKTSVLALARDRYQGFGPNLLAEKLAELHGLELSRGTLRQWLMEADLWRSVQQRHAAVLQGLAELPGA
jgi:hypothetical protein